MTWFSASASGKIQKDRIPMGFLKLGHLCWRVDLLRNKTNVRYFVIPSRIDVSNKFTMYKLNHDYVTLRQFVRVPTWTAKNNFGPFGPYSYNISEFEIGYFLSYDFPRAQKKKNHIIPILPLSSFSAVIIITQIVPKNIHFCWKGNLKNF